MNVGIMIETLPDSVKLDIIDITDVLDKEGNPALRIVLDRIITPEERDKLERIHNLVGPFIAHHRYAPEIEHSYFYLAE